MERRSKYPPNMECITARIFECHSFHHSNNIERLLLDSILFQRHCMFTVIHLFYRITACKEEDTPVKDFCIQIINNFSRISMKFKLLRKYKEIKHVCFGLWISNIYQIQKKERLFQRKTHNFGWLNIQTTKYKIRHSICQKKKHSKSYLERTQFMGKNNFF